MALLLLAAVPACARQGAPPGGPEDRRPPTVIGTAPDTFARVEAVEPPLVIRFNERISERPASGTLDGAVLVSPRTGEVRVEHARDALEVDLSGGFRPGLVYRVTVLPVIQDMFGNTMREPFEFVFSTGAPFTPNVVAGLVLERTTGEPAEGYEVLARPIGADSDTAIAHVTVTDTSGFFALRYLPPGRYRLTVFQDLNRNRTMDFPEARGSRGLVFRDADTVVVEVPVLRPDTTRAVLGRAVAETPTALRLEFDDFLDPDDPLVAVGVSLEPDTAAPSDAPPAPAVARVLHPPAWQARRDSIAAAEGGGAPPEAPRRIARPGEIPTTPGQERGRVAGADLPSRELFVLLEDTLPANVPYRITVTGVSNINGIPFGGGTAVVVRQPEPADTADAPPADTAGATGVPADTAGAADTVVVPPDTVAAPPDTAAADTAAAPPDTVVVPPDTAPAPARPDTAAVPPDTAPAPPDTVAVAPGTIAAPPDTAATPAGTAPARIHASPGSSASSRSAAAPSAEPPRAGRRGRSSVAAERPPG